VSAEKIIVLDDGSTDRTSEVASAYPVEVVRNPVGSGSKARAQNYALPHCDTELVLTVDADTILADDFIAQIKKPFADPEVVVAAGNVQVHNPQNVIERGRQAEYLLGMHYYREVQNMAHAPVVCSGCASALRLEALEEVGGFPPGTVAEDMDYSWRMMLAGHKAVYASAAECYVGDPKTFSQLKTQVHRWMAGYMQNIRTHWSEIWRGKKTLALWVTLAIIDILSIPLIVGTPLVTWWLYGANPLRTVAIFVGIDLLMTMPVVVTGTIRRKGRVIHALLTYPCLYVNRSVNSYYAIKAFVTELVLVPLGVTKGLQVFNKGH
jgi:cellulose synthase/poly-beta-1,6-N-acetylglucosamine synthase-like glycosyltransferase